MFEVVKEFEISAAHMLKLNYGSKCANLHGHNWHVTVRCSSQALNENGMVFDFTQIKSKVCDQLDHKDLTGLITVDGERKNPTAENIAYWIATQIGESCISVEVRESEGNTAIWRK